MILHTRRKKLQMKKTYKRKNLGVVQEIRQTIKNRRQQLCINQQTLADLAQVGINTIVAIERGKGNPSFATL